MRFLSGRLFLPVMFVLITVAASAQERFLEADRERMVRTQIEARGITDSDLLEAFRTVPRHEFVLPEYRRYAYNDQPLPIDEGQTISQPFIVAFMTEALHLRQNDRVLEVGTGSGYQAAILAQLCDSVFTIEIFETLTQKAETVFRKLAYNNIYCRVGDGYKGWPEKAPFDAIIVTCSPSHIPQALQQQLAEGGTMVIPVGDRLKQYLVLLTKTKGKIREKKILPVRFVPMIDKERLNY